MILTNLYLYVKILNVNNNLINYGGHMNTCLRKYV